MEKKLKHFFKKRKKKLILIAPYFYPRNYGGAVKIYDFLMDSLKGFKGIILTETQDSDPVKLREHNKFVKNNKNYDIIRYSELIFHTKDSTFFQRFIHLYLYLTNVIVSFIKLLKQNNVEVVICGDTFETGWLMSLVPKSIAKINYIHGEELTQETTHGPVRKLLRFFQSQAIKNADLNIVVSSFTKKKVREKTNIKDNRIKVLPNFVDTKRFYPSKNNKLRKKLHCNNKLILLTIARLIPRKGIDQAIKALARINKEEKNLPNWIYLIGGKGPEEENLKNLVVKNQLTDFVKFLGYVPDELLAEYYNTADIFIMTNREIEGDTEGFGIVFLEANACGTPVIGGIAGGTRDAIQDDVTGYRIDSNDIDVLSNTIIKLMKNKKLRETMGRAGFENVNQYHSQEKRAQKFEKLIKNISKNKK